MAALLGLAVLFALSATARLALNVFQVLLRRGLAE